MCNFAAAILRNEGSQTSKSPDGGIGRRAGLKHQWGNPCRFDPGSGYISKQFKISQVADIKALARFLILPHSLICSTFVPQVCVY